MIEKVDTLDYSVHIPPVTREEMAIGWIVLVFSLTGWMLPIALVYAAKALYPMLISSVVILGVTFVLQPWWGAARVGKVGIVVISIWGSVFLVWSTFFTVVVHM